MSGPGTSPDGGKPPRGNHGRYVRNPVTAERDAKACILRRDGKTYDYIAQALGYSDEASAYKGVQRAMLAIVREPAEELRNLELDRLDHMWEKTLEVLRKKHLTVQHGKVITVLDEDGISVNLEDDAPVLQAVDRLLKIQARRARLLGLDEPKKVEVLTMDVLDSEIMRLSAELGIEPGGSKERMVGS